MSSLTGAPRLLRGAIVSVDLSLPIPTVIVFQYNPDTMTRTIQAQNVSEGADRAEALRLKGLPRETIKLQVEIDANDQSVNALPPVAGIHPHLAALEMLIYPRALRAIANEVLSAVGVIEVLPPEAPLTVLVWGIERVVPVRITELTITEEAYDANLQPVRAKVDLGLRVMTYEDLGLLSPGGALFMAHQVIKETMALLSTAGAVAGVAASGRPLPGIG